MTDLAKALAESINGLSVAPQKKSIGTVLEAADGICQVSGLPSARMGEMVTVAGNTGMIMSLTDSSCGVVLFSGLGQVKAGDEVEATGSVLSVPTGEGMLGRVVNALGEAVDGGKNITGTKARPVEVKAPGIIERQPVATPLATGITAIDAMIPIGRGQRELIIGDRQTGKTAIAIDTILNQKGKDCLCVYVAIGQKASTVAKVVERLRAEGAMDYSVVVTANASDPAAMQFLAPYAGVTMAEYWMEKGKDVLIVYDDLSKQAAAYREMSLLLRRPPGREAYPGDIFYLHSRLLERAARLSEKEGGGSITALPIIETQANDVSAYIPTNVISITDGQIYLETDLFYKGIRPAVNAGLSVSRVGGAAQTKSMKSVSGSLRLSLAQFRELEAFAQIGSDLDEATQKQIERGQRIVEILKQPQYAPRSLAQQTMMIAALNEGLLDSVDPKKMKEFTESIFDFMHANYAALEKKLNTGGEKIEGAILKEIVSAVEDFKKGWK